ERLERGGEVLDAARALDLQRAPDGLRESPDVDEPARHAGLFALQPRRPDGGPIAAPSGRAAPLLAPRVCRRSRPAWLPLPLAAASTIIVGRCGARRDSVAPT